MFNIFIFSIFFGINFISFSPRKNQVQNITYPNNDCRHLEVRAQFPGGNKALKKFIKHNLKWPGSDWCGKGKVYIQFTIERTGEITKPKILRGINGANEEALRIIKLMPKWIPAYELRTKKKMSSQIILPINFSLR